MEFLWMFPERKVNLVGIGSVLYCFKLPWNYIHPLLSCVTSLLHLIRTNYSFLVRFWVGSLIPFAPRGLLMGRGMTLWTGIVTHVRFSGWCESPTLPTRAISCVLWLHSCANWKTSQLVTHLKTASGQAHLILELLRIYFWRKKCALC